MFTRGLGLTLALSLWVNPFLGARLLSAEPPKVELITTLTIGDITSKAYPTAIRAGIVVGKLSYTESFKQIPFRYSVTTGVTEDLSLSIGSFADPLRFLDDGTILYRNESALACGALLPGQPRGITAVCPAGERFFRASAEFVTVGDGSLIEAGYRKSKVILNRADGSIIDLPLPGGGQFNHDVSSSLYPVGAQYAMAARYRPDSTFKDPLLFDFANGTVTPIKLSSKDSRKGYSFEGVTRNGDFLITNRLTAKRTEISYVVYIRNGNHFKRRELRLSSRMRRESLEIQANGDLWGKSYILENDGQFKYRLLSLRPIFKEIFGRTAVVASLSEPDSSGYRVGSGTIVGQSGETRAFVIKVEPSAGR